jgi:hypothetical protein
MTLDDMIALARPYTSGTLGAMGSMAKRGLPMAGRMAFGPMGAVGSTIGGNIGQTVQPAGPGSDTLQGRGVEANNALGAAQRPDMQPGLEALGTKIRGMLSPPVPDGSGPSPLDTAQYPAGPVGAPQSAPWKQAFDMNQGGSGGVPQAPITPPTGAAPTDGGSMYGGPSYPNGGLGGPPGLGVGADKQNDSQDMIKQFMALLGG